VAQISSAQPTAPVANKALLASSGQSGLRATVGALFGAVGRAVGNTVSGLELGLAGLLYTSETRVTGLWDHWRHPLEKLPTPAIEHPFVLVPGWSTKPSKFTQLTDLLTRDGANGGQTYLVQRGKFFTLNPEGKLEPLTAPPPQAKVFEMVWTDTRQSPDRNLPEMRQNLDAICKATGADKVDAEAYSMGGLDARLYLDKGGSQIGRLLMLGSPNHGTGFGDIAADALDRGVDWATKLGGLSSDDRESMQWLREEAHSPQLQDLNSRWKQQEARVDEVLSVGTERAPTPRDAHGLRLNWGDGLVPASSLSLPDTKTIVFHQAMAHGILNDDQKVQHARCAFFGWGVPEDTGERFPDYNVIAAQVKGGTPEELAASA
jgi:pimeloyl-ACP methyl ester carboxylesterase